METPEKSTRRSKRHKKDRKSIIDLTTDTLEIVNPEDVSASSKNDVDIVRDVN